MMMIYDNVTNAACPQRPTWQISPVGYKWAQAVLLNCKQARPCKISKRAEVTPMLRKTRETILFAYTRAKAIFTLYQCKIDTPYTGLSVHNKV